MTVKFWPAFADLFSVETGEHYDTAYNYDTAVALMGTGEYYAAAVSDWVLDDGTLYRTVDEVQAMLNRERRLVEDCYGLTPINLPGE